MRSLVLFCAFFPIGGLTIAAPTASSITIGVSTKSGAIVHAYVAVVSDDQPWRRPLREEVLERSNSVIWTLPPGRYRVVAGAQGFAIAYGQPVELRAAEPRSVVLDLERTIGANENAATVTLPEKPSPVAGASDPPLRLLIEDLAAPKPPNVQRWLAGHAEPVTFRSAKATGGTVVEIAGGCRQGAVYVVDTGKSFGVTDPLLAASCGEPLHVKLLPAATLDTEFIPPSGSKVPPSGSVRLADCRRTSVRRMPDIPFAIKSGVARIRLPGGCSVPAFTAGDLTAAITPVKVAPDATMKLSAIRLERGATILARVVSSDQVPLAGIAVSAISSELKNTLRPAESLDALPTLASGITQDGGWVKLTGIAVGRDLVLMLRDKKRRTPVFTDVYRPQHTPLLLDSLELPSPASLTVHLQVPKDLTEHGVSALAVDAAAVEGSQWPKLQTLHARISQGTATFDDIPPGKWRIRALGRLEGSTLSPLGAITAEVTPGSHLTVDLPVDSNLYHGVVTLRGEPVRGDLTLRHERGATAQARLTDDGRFAMILAQTGVYQAQLSQRPGDGDLPYVTIPRIDITSNEHDVVIAIPEGRISGRVVDANGNGVANASVRATGTQIGESVQGVEGETHSTADGTFVLDGLSDGTWAVEARQEKRRTTPIELALSVGQQFDGVKLILSEAAKLTGQVTTTAGAPADGVLVILDRLGDAGFAGPLFARTGADGQFSIDISESLLGQLLDLKLRASDSSVASERLRATDPLLVQLPPTGSVRLSTGKDSITALMTVFVADDGSNLNVAFCHPKVAESGDGRTLTIPHLAAGHWRYVEARTPADVGRIMRGEAAVLPALASFSVQPGVTAEVNVRGEGGSRYTINGNK